MIPKYIVLEIERLQKNIEAKKERIQKLSRLAKLRKNDDLISEYDSIIKQADDTINFILESTDIMEPQKERIILHSSARVSLMARGLKNSLCDSEKQIELLNNAIEIENQRIKQLQSGKTENTGGIV